MTGQFMQVIRFVRKLIPYEDTPSLSNVCAASLIALTSSKLHG